MGPIVAPMSDQSVLHLLGPSSGGIRQHVAELTRQLNDHGWRSTVAGPVDVMSGLIDDASVVPVPASWSPLRFVRARRALRSLITDTAIVHAHGLKAALVVLSIRRRRTSVVMTLHNVVEGTHSGGTARVLARLQRAIVRRVDHLIVLSAESLDQFGSTASPQKLTLVMPLAPRPMPRMAPAEVRRLFDIDPDAPLVVVAARHHPQKDLPLFLHSLATVRASIPNVRALLVGDGPERPMIERTISLLDLEEVVIVAGHQDRPADALAAADVVAVSSRWEAGPLVSVECLQLGRPLVSTAVGAVSEHLVDRQHARLVPPGDADALAVAIVDVLVDRDASLEMAEAGRRLADEQFDASVLVVPVIDAYTATLLAASEGRSRR